MDGRVADRSAHGRAVQAFLNWTDRDPREIVGVLPPRQGEATIEKIATNAVMAGCQPEYFPVVITAIEALADPLFNLDSVQATTHPVAPLIVVNGPIARELGHQRRLQRLRPGLPRQRHDRSRGAPRAHEHRRRPAGHRRPRHPGQPGEDRVLRGRERGREPVGAAARGGRAAARREHRHRLRLRGAAQHPGSLQQHRARRAARAWPAPWARRAATTSSAAAGRCSRSGPSTRRRSRKDGYSKKQVKEFLFEHARYPLARLGPRVPAAADRAMARGRRARHDDPDRAVGRTTSASSSWAAPASTRPGSRRSATAPTGRGGRFAR